MDYGSTTELCRLSAGPQYLPISNFSSIACAHCLFYIYFLTPPYSKNYYTKICENAGLLICPKVVASITKNSQKFKEIDNFNCTCEQSPHRIFNLKEYSQNGYLFTLFFKFTKI